jgi:hypothetical protein
MVEDLHDAWTQSDRTPRTASGSQEQTIQRKNPTANVGLCEWAKRDSNNEQEPCDFEDSSDRGVQCGTHEDPMLENLIAIWAALDDRQRAALMAMARACVALDEASG